MKKVCAYNSGIYRKWGIELVGNEVKREELVFLCANCQGIVDIDVKKIVLYVRKVCKEVKGLTNKLDLVHGFVSFKEIRTSSICLLKKNKNTSLTIVIVLFLYKIML